MSLSRLALRLATVEALRPTASVDAYRTALAAGNAAAAAAVTWPTTAGPYVYDSRVDPLNDLQANEQRAIVSVFTENDNSDPGESAGGPPYKRIVDLVFELSVVGLGADPASPNTPTAVFLDADPETEAALDLVEFQIRFALHAEPSGKIWRDLTGRKVTDIESLPHRSSEEGIRLAQRVMRMKVRVPDDCPLAAPSATLVGAARIPDPLLSVFTALAATNYGAKILTGFAPDVPTMPTAVPLKTVGITTPVADPNGTVVLDPVTSQPVDVISASVLNLDQ